MCIRDRIISYFEAMVPETLPKSLLIMGSGAIGIEFASFYNTLGVDVTVVEMVDRIMPVEDAEISGIARKQFEKQGIKILTSAVVKKAEKGAPFSAFFTTAEVRILIPCFSNCLRAMPEISASSTGMIRSTISTTVTSTPSVL